MENETEELNPYEGILEAEGQQILSGISEIRLDPEEVDKLFSCDNPFLLTRAQRAVNVEMLRRQRAEYVEKKKAKRQKKEKAPPPEIGGLKLEDLDLDITKI
jgi:hypothetical protein